MTNKNCPLGSKSGCEVSKSLVCGNSSNDCKVIGSDLLSGNTRLSSCLFLVCLRVCVHIHRIHRHIYIYNYLILNGCVYIYVEVLLMYWMLHYG